MVMIFANEKARNYLLEHGEVYTFRTKMHKTGKDWINEARCKPKLCNVQIELAIEVTGAADLIPYTAKSGFEHSWDWTSEIFKLNPKLKKIRGYLYHVVRRP